MIILSYHRFVEQESEYRFSRTYEQFWHDIRKKEFDLITIDDGMSCMLKACEMLKQAKIRAKLFISPDLIGKEGYCTWEDLKIVSRFHDIENHSYRHVKLIELDKIEIRYNILTANKIIKDKIGKKPSYFVAPWNMYNSEVDRQVKSLGLKSLKNRENILNISK